MNTPSAALNGQEQDRGALARMVTRLFEHWGLSSEDQLAMLVVVKSFWPQFYSQSNTASQPHSVPARHCGYGV